MNRLRGESILTIRGRRYTLCLTLGALAEIQQGLGLEDLSAIGPRLAHLRAADLAILASALIRGGGEDLSPAEVLQLSCPLPQLIHAISAAFGSCRPDCADTPHTEEDNSAPFAGIP